MRHPGSKYASPGCAIASIANYTASRVLLWVVKPAFFCLLIGAGTDALLAQSSSGIRPLLIGRVKITPEAFVDLIAEWRSATTSDSVWTGFGRIPLDRSDPEMLGSLEHSRGMVHIDLPVGPMTITTYLEQDFMRSPDGTPFRWRQYWGRVKLGRWEVLGGKAWSLLRPHRVGMAPERELMNTDVVEPNYHVGLVGQRRQQVRLTYSTHTWSTALAWESTTGFWLGKYGRDFKNMHLEIAAFIGREQAGGVSAAQVARVLPKLRVVGQQFVSKHALTEALGIVPPGVTGASNLFGAEAPLTPMLELFGYYGLVYGCRNDGNRLTSQYSVGFHQRVMARPRSAAAFTISLQYSQVKRAVWSGAAGSMEYVQTRLRYTF